jgi:hypothetical protein
MLNILRRTGGALRATVLIIGNTVILLAVCLVVGEIWARSTLPPVPEATGITVQNEYAAYHPWAGFRNTPGFRYVLGDWTPVVINSWGWRGPEPSIERTKGVRRAILLGDSVGFSCWGCREDASFGGALKRALEVRTDEEWEVINTSVGAGFSSLSLGTLAHDGMQFKPDVVVSLNGINDILVLDDRTILHVGTGLFKHSLYHKTQIDMAAAFDPRTGQINQPGIIDQIEAKSALFQALSKTPFVMQLGAAKTTVPQILQGQSVSTGYSVEHMERLDHYVTNELAMSYLTAGSGAKFIGFLQPYLSRDHKIQGEADRKVVEGTDPQLLTWMDEAMPRLRDKLAKAAEENPSFRFVDLSRMFIDPPVFADLAHFRYETEQSTGYELLAGRMADEIVASLAGGAPVRDWRKTHLANTPYDWNESAYLAANPDVREMVAHGEFSSGFEHYRKTGFLEFRHSGFPSWDESGYLAANPDVRAMIERGEFATGYEHYVKQGKSEGRRKGLPMRWIEETYLEANPDVAAAVKAHKFASGEEHFMKLGAREGRNGGFSGWDEEGYLIRYGDVRNSLRTMFHSGIEHYLAAGAREGRLLQLGLVSPQ